MRGRAAPPTIGTTAAPNPVALVKEALRGGLAGRGTVASGARMATPATATSTPAMRYLGMLFAIYLCFNSLRVQEVITALAIPKLPMLMSLVLAAGLVFAVRGATWAQLWAQSPAFKWQTLITVLAIVTVPLGIWVSNSLDLLYPGYFISVTVFLGGIALLRDRVVLLRTFAILAGVATLITLLVLLGVGAGSVEGGRITVGTSLDPNNFAWILATFVPVALWLGVRRKGTALFWFGAAALMALTVVPTQSRGGFLALMAVAGVLTFFGATGWRRAVMFLALALLSVGVLAYINATGASRLTDFSGYEGGTGRMDLWKQGLRWMVARPWGYGMGNYNTYNVWMTRGAHGAHSAYIGIGVELGLVAGVAYLAIWLGVARRVFAVRKHALAARAHSAVAAEEASLCGFVLAMMAGNAVGSAFLNTQYAALTLLVQSVGVAVVLGSPFRAAAPAAGIPQASPATASRTGSAERTHRLASQRAVRRGGSSPEAIPRSRDLHEHREPTQFQARRKRG